MLPDDDKRYAIETCRSSESVLKSDLKINDTHTISAFVGCVIFSEHLLYFYTTIYCLEWFYRTTAKAIYNSKCEP